jgi:hypothetical protein
MPQPGWLCDSGSQTPVWERFPRNSVSRDDEEKHMPFMTSIERLARTEELLTGIEMLLDLKFGAESLRLMPEIQQITDVEKLRSIRAAIKGTATLEELQRLWKP